MYIYLKVCFFLSFKYFYTYFPEKDQCIESFSDPEAMSLNHKANE